MTNGHEIQTIEQDVNQNHIVLDNLIEKSSSLKPVTLTWKNIIVDAPIRNTSKKIIDKFRNKNNDSYVNHKTIVNNVSGIANAHEILAIMGASGAGKTTLLNVLNFRNRGSLKIYGEIRVNGQLIESVEEIASISGYVQQDDLFPGSLTVRENLIFQAMLRMDKSFSRKQRLQRVEEVLQDLNLKKCEDVPISIEDKKGISGGEKRRLAFASEVLTNPLILFCDEPTSGLDSFIALSVVDCMKSLAKQGKTIICTIHQPSSEIFEMFDKLCLLAEGRLAFIGTLPNTYEFFNSQNLPVPNNYNPADFYIKQLAVIPFDKENSLKRIDKICNGFEKNELKQKMMNEIDNLSQKYLNKDIDSINFNEEVMYKSNFFTQMYWLLWRNVISSVRNPIALRVQVFQGVLIGLIFGLVYFQLKLNQKGIQNITSLLFLCVTNHSFGCMFAVVNVFPAEIPIFYREHQNRMYRVISYYLAKLFLDIPIFTMLPVIFITIIYWMANLNNEISRFFICIGIIILVAQVAVSFGTFLSACSPNTNTALVLSGPINVPFMIFSGFLLNSEDIPKYFLFLRYLSWFGYANENLLINQFLGIDNIECDYPDEPNCFKKFSTGADVLDFYKIDPESFYLNICCLLILIIGWRIMAFFVLLIKSREK